MVVALPRLSAHGSVEQVYVTGAIPGEQLSLVESAGSTMSTKCQSATGIPGVSMPPDPIQV